MKRDPHKHPITLTGQWSYSVAGKKMPLEGSFWFVASRLALYRKANRLPRASYEQCQMDVLVAARKAKGLTTELASPVPEALTSPVKRFVKEHYELPKRRCRSCGKR